MIRSIDAKLCLSKWMSWTTKITSSANRSTGWLKNMKKSRRMRISLSPLPSRTMRRLSMIIWPKCQLWRKKSCDWLKIERVGRYSFSSWLIWRTWFNGRKRSWNSRRCLCLERLRCCALGWGRCKKSRELWFWRMRVHLLLYRFTFVGSKFVISFSL